MTGPGQAGEAPLVAVVDDDEAIRSALGSLLRSVGFRVETFGATQDFLASDAAREANCLILDIRLPRVGGLEFQSQLAAAGIAIPIIFMTGHGDIPMTVRAMKAGAVDFLAKPFRDQDMLDAVTAAIERDRQRREGDGLIQDQRARYRCLSEREKEVMALAASGLMNKQIAFELGISEITVKIHRGRVMRKMEASSFADLVRMAEALEIRRDKPAR
ncbi:MULTISPECIES: response regulator [Rhodomicrobium]|uniref:response regulator transcription factor n=1 Tax=Rhodomicrobium TaxID=1068 RepID=UPI000B4C095D|nr:MULTISPECIES: response regulator [Rhodomicrobium]